MHGKWKLHEKCHCYCNDCLQVQRHEILTVLLIRVAQGDCKLHSHRADCLLVKRHDLSIKLLAWDMQGEWKLHYYRLYGAVALDTVAKFFKDMHRDIPLLPAFKVILHHHTC